MSTDNGPKLGVGRTPPPPPSLDQLLTGLLKSPEVKGLYYNGKTVILDGYHFVECRFDNCTLEVSTLNFSLQNCVIDPSTSIIYKLPSLKLLKLFNSRYPWAQTFYDPGFLPTKNPDGSITI